MRRQRVTFLVGLTVLAAATLVSAGESERKEETSFSIAPGATVSRPFDRFSARLGGFAVRFKTSARVDSETLGIGDEFDLEGDTALDRSTTEARLDGHVRLGKRHRLDYGYIGFRRTGFRMLDREIQFGDDTFEFDAELTTEFKNDLFKLAYRYDVVRRPGWDLGLSFGLSAFAFDLGLQAVPAGGGAIIAENEDFIAPIPMLGLHTDVKLAKNWYFRAGAEFFDVDVDDFEGKVADTRAAIDWYPFQHFGFGVGFNRVHMTIEDTGLPGLDITYIFSGTMVYASYVR